MAVQYILFLLGEAAQMTPKNDITLTLCVHVFLVFQRVSCSHSAAH